MSDQSGNHQHGSYSVSIAKDGAIKVKSGDSVSAYSAAIYKLPVHKTQAHWGEFGRIVAGDSKPTPLADPNSIELNETLYHLDTYTLSQKEEEEEPVPSRLQRVAPLITDAKASCLVRKAIALSKNPGSVGNRDAWHAYIPALRYAKHGGSGQNFDYAMAETALDAGANHVLPFLRRASKRNEKDADFANAIVRQSGKIVTEMELIRAKTRSVGQLGKPELSAIDAWVRTRLKDSGSALSCYADVYGQ